MTWADPGYFEDFWTVRGYVGADDQNLAQQVYEVTTTVGSVLTAEDLLARGGNISAVYYFDERHPVAITLNDGDVSRMAGGAITLLSGKAVGRELAISAVLGDALGAVTGPYGYPELFDGVAPGDEILVSNRKFLAQCYWPQYHLEGELEYRPNHTWAVDGQQIYPQRKHHSFMNMGPDYLYHFDGKMILVQSTPDINHWEPAATEYHAMARRSFGDQLDDHFRLWWNEGVPRTAMLEVGTPPKPHFSTWEVEFVGAVDQAVFDLIEWIENGKEPPPTTGYEYSPDGKVTLAPSAAERKGIQPVVRASANGAIRAEVKVSEPVNFEAEAEVPGGTGKIIGAEWDFEGDGTWPFKEEGIDGTSDSIRLSATHSFDTPGTYFPAVRVTAHRNGDIEATKGRLPNLGRVRVVVS